MRAYMPSSKWMSAPMMNESKAVHCDKAYTTQFFSFLSACLRLSLFFGLFSPMQYFVNIFIITILVTAMSFSVLRTWRSKSIVINIIIWNHSISIDFQTCLNGKRNLTSTTLCEWKGQRFIIPSFTTHFFDRDYKVSVKKKRIKMPWCL